MNILLVDDNQYILDGMLDGIDFTKLGFAQVFTARSMKKAKALLGENRIEIVVTDIEMPGGTGLELLEWVNREFPQIVTIFCTSYPDFNYAKEAIRLQCFDYYLKPIQYAEFVRLLERAVEKVKQQEQENEIREFGVYWLDNQWNNKGDFWYKYLYRMNDITKEELQEEIVKRKLDYSLEGEMDICIIKLGKQINERKLSENIKDFIFRNILEEVFTKEAYKIECVLITANNTVTLILSRLEKGWHGLRQLCGVLLDELHKYVARESNCYYRECVKLHEAKCAVRLIEEVSLDDVSNVKKIVNYDSLVKEKNEIVQMDLKEWENLLRNKKKEALEWKVNEYIRGQMRSGYMTRQDIQKIRSTIVQVSCTILRENNIEAYRLFGDAYYGEIFTDSVKSIANMQRFVEYVIEKTIDYIREIEESETYIDKIVKYVEANYNRNIRKGELESIALANMNQISKVFKEKTGKTIHRYQMDIRLNRAITLLSEGRISVSEVALTVGYDNFSYFSRLFKNRTGVSPKEYRNAVQDTAVRKYL